MKKLIFASLALLALASCAKNEVTVVENQPQEITFQTVVGPMTKATETSFKHDAKFQTYAYFTTGAWASASEKKLYIDNATISYDETNDVWKGTYSYYWPEQGYLTFFSWADNDGEANQTGATVSCTSDAGIKVENYAITSNKDKDFMTAKAIDHKENTTDNGKNTDYPWSIGVPTVFNHELCTFVFNAKLDKTYTFSSGNTTRTTTIKVKSISFKNIYDKATYVQTDDAEPSPTTDTFLSALWTSHSDVKDFTMYSTESSALSTDNTTLTVASTDYSILMPQTIPTNATFDITYEVNTKEVKEGTEVVNTTETVNRSILLNLIYTNNWLPRHRYILNLTIGLDEIHWDPIVADWTDVEINYATIF